METLDGIEGLLSSVVRIVGGDKGDPNRAHSGTGFYYSFRIGEDVLPVIVSNKHVLCDKSWLAFDFATADRDGNRHLGAPAIARVNEGELPIFLHPDPEVDLAAVPFMALNHRVARGGVKLHLCSLTNQNFMPPDSMGLLESTAPLLMIGFPNGIMDDINNVPIARRGSLATPYAVNYKGRKDFVVDIATYGGSSGSPVFAIFEHSLPDREGREVKLLAKPRIFFIGVLHSGPVMTETGQIVEAPIPTAYGVPQFSLRIHLGYCLKANLIEELLPVIQGHRRMYGW